VTTNVDISSAPRVEIAPRWDAAPVATEARSGSPWWRGAPVLVAAAIAVVYLIVQPRTVDLAAAVFRSRLFDEAGFTIWNNSWYSGHPTWSYSVLVPPLTWLFSPALVGALSGVASAALFEPLARRHFGGRAARWGALWFGAGAMTPVLSGRITFACGVAAALAALLALQRGKPWPAAALALATGLLSPIAGLFLALACAAYALADVWPRAGAEPRAGPEPERGAALTRLRPAGVALTAAALAPPALVSILFPDGREGPFVFSAFWPLPLFALAFFAAIPARERTLRTGALLYAVAAVGAFAITTPVGGNAVRLGALVGGPLLLCALLAARRRITLPLLALLVAFGVWQWSAAVRDIAQTAGDRSTEASFYKPLNDFLAAQVAGRTEPFRVEIPFTFSHWETAEVAPRFDLARGWLRPDDRDYNHLFYDGSLDAGTYRAWLAEHAVRFVAVPRDVKPDYSARAELRLIDAGLPYLRPVFGSSDWQVYEFAEPHPLAIGAQATRTGIDDATLRFARPGAAIVRLRWSPYWLAEGGCVERAGEWTRVIASRPGELRLEQSFSIGRVLDHGRRCA
jgi:hypothetical protein